MIHLLDFYLRNLEGHNIHYDLALTEALRALGAECQIHGNEHADPDVCRQHDIRACLPEWSSAVARFTGQPWLAASVLAQRSRFRRRVSGFLTAPGFLQHGDVLLLPTVFVFDLYDFCVCVARHRALLQRHHVTLMIMLRFEVRRKSAALSLAFRWLHQKAFRTLRDCGVSVCYLTDTEALAADYQAALGLRPIVCPIPIRAVRTERTRSETDGRLTVSFLGAARHNKGFDLFVETLERLARDGNVFRRLRIQVQAYLQPGSQTAGDMRRLRPYVERLRILAANHANILVLPDTLSADRYDDLLRATDIAILPYRPESFRSASSNVLPECICNGIIPLAGDNTWLAAELRRAGLGGFVFASEQCASIEDILRQTLTTFTQCQHEVRLLAAKWRLYHCPANLAEAVLNQIRQSGGRSLT